MSNQWQIDPADTLNFKFDLAALENGSGNSNWLDRTSSPQEYISGQSVSIDSPGPTIEASSVTDNNTSVTLSISAANCVAGNVYPITCTITTSTGQVTERTAYLHVINR